MKKHIEFFKKISRLTEKQASLIKSQQQLALSKFIALISFTHNWQAFDSEEKALHWLQQ